MPRFYVTDQEVTDLARATKIMPPLRAIAFGDRVELVDQNLKTVAIVTSIAPRVMADAIAMMCNAVPKLLEEIEYLDDQVSYAGMGEDL